MKQYKLPKVSPLYTTQNSESSIKITDNEAASLFIEVVNTIWQESEQKERMRSSREFDETFPSYGNEFPKTVILSQSPIRFKGKYSKSERGSMLLQHESKKVTSPMNNHYSSYHLITPITSGDSNLSDGHRNEAFPYESSYDKSDGQTCFVTYPYCNQSFCPGRSLSFEKKCLRKRRKDDIYWKVPESDLICSKYPYPSPSKSKPHCYN